MRFVGDSRQLHLLSGLAQRHLDVHFLFSAIDRNLHRVAGAMRIHDLGKILLVLHVFAVDRDDQVAAQHDRDVAQVRAFVATAQAGALGGPPGETLTISKPKSTGRPICSASSGPIGDGRDAQCRAAHPAERDQVVQHGLGGVDGDGEADARILADAGKNHGVDADDLAMASSSAGRRSCPD